MNLLSRLILRSLAVVIILVGLVGFPYLLVTIVGWPLPHHLPSVTQLHSIYTTPIPDSFWPKALAVVAWVAWLYFVLAIGATVISSVGARKEGERSRARRGAVHALVATAISPGVGAARSPQWRFWDDYNSGGRVASEIPSDNIDLDGFAPTLTHILIRSRGQTVLWYIRNYWPGSIALSGVLGIIAVAIVVALV